MSNKPPTAGVRLINLPDDDNPDDENIVSIKLPSDNEPGYIEAVAGVTLEFTGDKSEDDQDSDDKLTVMWKLSHRDGRAPDEGEGLTFKKVLNEVGTYKLVVTVKDTQGKSDTLQPAYVIHVKEQSRAPINTDDWWMEWNSENIDLPSEALIVSREEENYEPSATIYLCRARDQGRLKPGKLLISPDESSTNCYVPRYQLGPDGSTIQPDEETRPSISYTEYEIFIPEADYKWSEADEISDDDHRVYTDEGHPDETVICRMEYGQTTEENRLRVAKHPGMLDKATNHCIFPWGNVSGYLDREDRKDTYEILVITAE
jgi:hypothetical protein